MKKEGKVLFNDALNTFYFTVICRRIYMKKGNVIFNDSLNTYDLRLCGVRHMVKDR